MGKDPNVKAEKELNKAELYYEGESYKKAARYFYSAAELYFELDEYTNYYTTSSHTITYDDSTYLLNTSFISFYDSDSITFLLPQSEINFTAVNASSDYLDLSITFEIPNNYEIIFSEKTGNDTVIFKNYDVKPGASSAVTGISINLLNSTNLTYSELKQSWNIPTNNNFKFFIYDSANSLIYNYTKTNPTENQNVYSDIYTITLLDTEEQGKLIINSW